MATANEGFKASLLQDLRLQRNLIDHFLNDTFTAAELAVEDLFSNQGASDAVEKLDELNTLLKICRERFAQVGNIVASFKPIVLPSKKTQVSNETNVNVNFMLIAHNAIIFCRLPFLLS